MHISSKQQVLVVWWRYEVVCTNLACCDGVASSLGYTNRFQLLQWCCGNLKPDLTESLRKR